MSESLIAARAPRIRLRPSLLREIHLYRGTPTLRDWHKQKKTSKSTSKNLFKGRQPRL